MLYRRDINHYNSKLFMTHTVIITLITEVSNYFL